MKPLISVIVPVYNVKKYVEKCLDSILRQKYKNLDIVVVDDGSTDGSGEICDKYATKDKRVRVFRKKNGGLSDARNFGLRKAKGDIVAFVDSDDFVNEDFVGAMLGSMKKNNADVVVCGYNDIVPNEENMSGEEAAVKLLTHHENVDTVTWNKMYKKSLFLGNEIWFPVGKKHEDTLTTYKLLAKAKNVSYINKSLYYYIDRKSSIMNTEKIEGRLAMRELAAKEAVDYFCNHNDLRQAAEISLLLAKYAYLDFAIAGKINENDGRKARRWITENANKYKGNKYLSKKLKIYNILSTKIGGVGYLVFRKIRHE